jgi:uncharacterized protein
MWIEKLLARYLEGVSFDTVLEHSRYVAALALDVCDRLALGADERVFIEEAALLHDIGVSRVYAPDIGLHGIHPYIMHGVLGRAILEEEGYPVHALVCERHIGVGLTVADIERQQLPLPRRDMCPVSLSEQIICFADLFFSKQPGKLSQRKKPERIRKKLASFGEDKAAIFDSWMKQFGGT